MSPTAWRRNMTSDSSMTIRLAAVQVQSQPRHNEANRQHATPYIEQAAAQGAQLVVLAELFSCGYLPNRAVWDAAESPHGPTARWLAATARRLGIYLGAGSAETDGSDFFNVFILANPGGEIAGRAYKANAEANVFRRDRRVRAIDTPIGRIGIGICADNQFAAHLQLMHDLRADVILMPHAWPTPSKAAGLVSEDDVATQRRRMIELPSLYARSLGVPVVFVNQIGPLMPIGGILGRLMNPRIWRLCGQSRIIDSDGCLLGQLAEQEGVLTAVATMDPRRKHYRQPPSYGGWLQPGSALARKVIIPLDILTGTLTYSRSRERARKARACAVGSAAPTTDKQATPL
jgi:N-carbamoylputrescine amidase